mmetsp:Transcript_19082/g.48186  ORF Transcript_19082/g.48186 Transcript_19082/m.48186 type:complete len:218 (-) Transcript_19082:220-873(-)
MCCGESEAATSSYVTWAAPYSLRHCSEASSFSSEYSKVRCFPFFVLFITLFKYESSNTLSTSENPFALSASRIVCTRISLPPNTATSGRLLDRSRVMAGGGGSSPSSSSPPSINSCPSAGGSPSSPPPPSLADATLFPRLGTLAGRADASRSSPLIEEFRWPVELLLRISDMARWCPSPLVDPLQKPGSSRHAGSWLAADAQALLLQRRLIPGEARR